MAETTTTTTVRYRFRYVRTAAGELSGPSMIIQTELALSEIGNTAIATAEEALATANTALETAETADEKAERAEATADEALALAKQADSDATAAGQTADQALAEARQAQATADEGVAKAEAAQTTADEALEKAEKAQEAADQAQQSADDAQATADQALEEARAAQQTADGAQQAADVAQAVADDALEKAQDAQTSADRAQETADANAEAIEQLEEKVDSEDGMLESRIDSIDARLAEMTDLWEIVYTDDLMKYFGETVKLYIPEGISISQGRLNIESPLWFWTSVSEDGLHTVEYVRTEDGTIYTREGTATVEDLGAGENTFTLSIPGVDGTVGITVSADGTVLSVVAENGTVIDATQDGDTLSFDLSVLLSDAGESGVVTCTYVNSEGEEVAVDIGTIADGLFFCKENVTAGSATLNLLTSEADDDGNLSLHCRIVWAPTEVGDETWSLWHVVGEGDSAGSSCCNWFALVEDDVDLDDYPDTVVKDHLTGTVTNAPAGTTGPYWFWNFVEEEGGSSVQWILTADGELWTREWNFYESEPNNGTESFTGIVVPGLSDPLAITVSSVDGEISVRTSYGEITYQTAEDGEIVAVLVLPIEDGNILWNGEIVGSIDLTNGTVSGGEALVGTNCTLQIDHGSLEDGVLTLVLTGNWQTYTTAHGEWTEWRKIGPGAGGSGGGDDIQEASLVVADGIAYGESVTLPGSLQYTYGMHDLQVFWNGLKLTVGLHYEEARDGDSVTLLFDAEPGDVFDFLVLGDFTCNDGSEEIAALQTQVKELENSLTVVEASIATILGQLRMQDAAEIFEEELDKEDDGDKG